jgi:hypothetical protein
MHDVVAVVRSDADLGSEGDLKHDDPFLLRRSVREESRGMSLYSPYNAVQARSGVHIVSLFSSTD